MIDKKNLTEKIEEKFLKTPKGTIFTISDFYDLGNRDAVKKALSRLNERKIIVRLIDGYYTIPPYIKVINEYSYPSAISLANKISEKYSWTICPTGITALNHIGLSTQVPNVYEFISDGPYRKIAYLGQFITFKHTTNRAITNFSRELSLAIQSIKAIGEQNLTQNDLILLSKYCKLYVKENIILDTKAIPAWIYKILTKVSDINI